MWRATIKGLLAHKLRAALVGLAIVIGVTFVSGTLILTDTLHGTFSTLFSNIYQHVDFVVRGKAAFGTGGNATRKPIPDSLGAEVKALPGVADARGTVSGYAQFVGRDGKVVSSGGAPTIGLSFDNDTDLSPLTVVRGSAPVGPHEVAMDAHTATADHWSVGQRVRILFLGPTQTFTISGIVRFGTADDLAGATIAAFSLPAAQRLFDDAGVYDSIDVRAAPGTNLAALQRRIAAILPKGVEVVTGTTVEQEQNQSLNQVLSIFSTSLLVFAFVALFVGAFTIFNTFSIIVGQRTKELALLRILGASRSQLVVSVLAEAGIVGLVSALVGLGLGALTALGLVALLKAFGISLPTSGLVFLPRTAIVAIVVGVGVTVVSAISPARRAVRIPPVAALAEYDLGAATSSRRRFVVGTAVTVAGVASIAGGLTAPAIALVGLGAVLVFVGVTMLAPLAARPMASVLGRPVARLFGVPGRLGRENAMRSPRRTAQTAAALMVGLALTSTLAVFGASLAGSATSSVSQAVSADYIVTASGTGSVSDAVAGAAGKIAGVRAVATVYADQFLFRQSIVGVTGIDPVHLADTIILRMVSGDASTALSSGELLIDSDTANSDNLVVGSVVPATFAETGRSTLRIGGIFQPNALLGRYLVSTTFFVQHFRAPTPVAVLLRMANGPTPASTHALDAALRSYPQLTIQTRAQFEQSQEKAINTVVNLADVLLLLAVGVAFIGIVNTLLLSVFERTHEIGLLRSVGMRRAQVRSMIRSEALILALFGAVIGIVIGALLGVALASSLARQGFNDIVVPPDKLVLFLIVGAVIGLIAAWWPARRAARMDVLQAISTL